MAAGMFYDFKFLIVVTSLNLHIWGHALIVPELELLHPTENEPQALSAWKYITFRFRGLPRDDNYTLRIFLDADEMYRLNTLVWHEDFSWAWDVHLTFVKSLLSMDEWTVAPFCIMESCEIPVKVVGRTTPPLQLNFSCLVEMFDSHEEWLASVSTTFSVCDVHANSSIQKLTEADDLQYDGELETTDWKHFDVSKDALEFADEKWETKPDAWLLWWLDGMSMASRCIFDNCWVSSNTKDVIVHNFDFPVYVMNLERRLDRKRHMTKLMKSLGFSKVLFPRTTRAADVDLAAAVADGVVTQDGIDRIAADHGADAVPPYVANAANQLAIISSCARAGTPLFGIFEDDLAAGAPPSEVNQLIAAALTELPADADMLYLEACFDECSAFRYSAARPRVARAAKPFCSAAVLFTRRGARRVAELCSPVFAGVDDMYESLIGRGLLRAYLALPGLLFQDGYWGTDARRWRNQDYQAGARRVHTMIAPVCEETESGWRISMRAPVAPAAEVRAAAAAAGDAALLAAVGALEAEGKCFNCSYVLLPDPTLLCPSTLACGSASPAPPTQPAGGGLRAVLLAASAGGGSDDAEVELCWWADLADMARPALARIGPRDECWEQDECSVVLVVEDSDGLEVERHASVVLLERASPFPTASAGGEAAGAAATGSGYG